MHISEGVLSAPVLVAGGALAAAGVAVGLRKLDYERVPQVAMLSAAFFVASLIHVPVGPSNVHLVLNGLVGLVLSMLSFRDTPMSEPVTRGLYRVSRHPQLVALFILFAGMCLAVGSWPALFALAISRALQHFGILAEEGACLAQYGDSYRAYLERVPRYLLLF